MRFETFEKLNFFIETAEYHERRLHQELAEIKSPVQPSAFQDPDLNTVKVFELFSSRFAKLQDILGAKIFTLFLYFAEELSDSMTFIDKLLKLERLGIIDSADSWLALRQIRNTITHDFPMIWKRSPQVSIKPLRRLFCKKH